MTTVALPDVKALPLKEQTETANPKIDDAAAERQEPPGGEVHTLHEKLENAFAPSQAELPPKIYQSGFDAAVRQQTAAFHDLSARVEKLEDREEINDLRNALREMCEILSGLTAEQERAAAERDAKLQSLAEAMAAEHAADREKFKALIETITAERENDRERVKALTEVAAAERAADHVQLLALQEGAKAAAANHEKAMAEVRSGLTLIGDHIGTMTEQNEGLSRELNMMKNEFLRETEAALDKHWNALSEMEKAISVLKNHDGHTANRVAILESNDENLARRIEKANETIAAAAEKSIVQFQTGQRELLAAMENLKDEISDDVTVTFQGHRHQLAELEKSVGTLREHDLQTEEQVKMLRVYTGSLTRDVDAVRKEVMTFNESAAVMQAHQQVLEQTEVAVNRLKDHASHAASRLESLHSDLSELTGRVDAQAHGARALEDRLNNAERVLAQTRDRERTMAELHARAADMLRSGETS